MKRSPFPGMDPWLEAHWLDVHTSLIADSRNALNQVLPDDLAASSEERVAVESDNEDDSQKEFYPDVQLFEALTAAVAVAGGAALAPVRLLAQIEPVTERSIRIVNSATGRLITVIEYLSPFNKRNPGLVDCRAKRAELITAGVNFVEVDLVREGNWRALLHPHVCPEKWTTPYRVTIRTPSDPAAVGLYPISLREPLPSIAISFRRGDPHVSLDLQALLNQAYANGRYGRRLKYNLPPEPVLDVVDREWAEAMIQRALGLSSDP